MNEKPFSIIYTYVYIGNRYCHVNIIFSFRMSSYLGKKERWYIYIYRYRNMCVVLYI